MELLQVAVWGIAVFTVLGLLFGIALAATARRFHVATNPVIDEVKDNLPAANCGACGYGGCAAYAEHVVEDGDVSPTLCTPGGQEIAITIGELTGKKVGEIKEEVAMLRCAGIRSVAREQATYVGIHTCAAAALSFGGPKACKYGCLGLGDCQRACAFDAIRMTDDGIVAIDEAKCTGCGLCVDACPKQTLEMMPRHHRVLLSCTTRDKGKSVKNVCTVGCIQCQLCIKECPAEAISFDENGVINVDHETCTAYGPGCEQVCVAVCPTDIIHMPGMLPDPEKKAKEKAAKAAAKKAAEERTGTDG
ncbi:MAG: Fe-S cluster domain-containing protein [Gammaproteobacteria bacterium]|jgi:electron transport complex protein RnfB|nr:Fe-S cluster domain-containing protein [Gammaproteobacteria bacterium]